jgi:hypothetical protein
MNALPATHDIGLLRRQLKNDLIDYIRARQTSDDRLSLADILIRGLTCRLKAYRESNADTPEAIADKIYAGNHIQRAMLGDAMRPEPWRIAKAAVSPASTQVSGWASELVGTTNYSGLLPQLMPASAYSQLSQHGLRIPFEGGAGIVSLPARLTSPLIAGAFIGEGEAIPTRRVGLMATPFGPPKKLAVLSRFSSELQERSVPTIESVLRESIAIDTSQTIDSKLLDNVAGSAIRPPGLLNGISGITATSGGGLAALVADLGALAAAIPNPADLVYIMSPADHVRAATVAPSLAGISILVAPGLTAKTVIALDGADFVSGEGDQPRFDLSDQGVIHSEDTNPLPIGTPGSPNVVAAPSVSLYQQDLVSLRCIWHVVWAMRRPGRVSFTSSVTC